MTTIYSLAVEPSQIPVINKLPAKFDSVYLGSDVCEHKIPSLSDVSKVLPLCRKIIIPLPPLTDRIMENAAFLFEKALKMDAEIEASPNDIGTLLFLRERFGNSLTINMGRHLFGIQAKNSLAYTENFSREYDINCFESDDPHTATSFLQTGRFKIAFHYPYRCYAMTRTCNYNVSITEKCSRKCGLKYIPLGNTGILWHGNAYYLKISEMPSVLPQRVIITHNFLEKK